MQLSPPDLHLRARAIRWLVFDVDGVLTDGRIWYAKGGQASVAFDIKDGLALKLAQRAGLRVALLSGRASPGVEARAAELGLDCVLLGEADKGAAFDAFLTRNELAPEHVAYLGDDLPDLPVLRRCGLALAPADAIPEVQALVHQVLAHRGGRGAAREAVELILRSQARWEEIVSGFDAHHG